MTPAMFLHLSDTELINRTKYARNPKIKSIRKESSLSVKQRYALAQWLSENQ